MVKKEILFVGGSGVVGSRTVKLFRERHADIPILIGGRNLAKARKHAETIDCAEGIRVDTAEPGLGLPKNTALAAVVMMVPDEGLHGLSLAQERGVPYLSIGNWLAEVGAEMAYFMRNPQASPIVLSSHWHGGAAIFLTQVAAVGMDSIQSIKIGAIVDDLDATGPAALKDMEKGDGGIGAMAFENGRRVLLSGQASKRTIKAIDGREFVAAAFAPYDVVSLHALTQARQIRFDIGSGVSSSRLHGGDIATELIIEIEGQIGAAHHTRHATLEFARGQATLTGFSVVLTLSAVLGLEGHTSPPPGLYFPEHLVNAQWFLNELIRAGATVTGTTPERDLSGTG